MYVSHAGSLLLLLVRNIPSEVALAAARSLLKPQCGCMLVVASISDGLFFDTTTSPSIARTLLTAPHRLLMLILLLLLLQLLLMPVILLWMLMHTTVAFAPLWLSLCPTFFDRRQIIHLPQRQIQNLGGSEEPRTQHLK